MASEYWVRRQGKVHGPFTYKQVTGGVKSGKLAASDEVATAQGGPWTPIAKVAHKLQSQTGAPAQIPAALAQRHSAGPPPAASRNPATASPPLPFVHQLDNTVFLVENLSKAEIFDRLKAAVQENHSLTGSFARSFLLRGQGTSGINFALQVNDHDDGVIFTIEGDTPDGPANFQAWFNPLTVAGWGLFAVTELFNSHANATAAARVQSDFQMLLINLLTAFNAEHLFGGEGGTTTTGPLARLTVDVAGGTVLPAAGAKCVRLEPTKLLVRRSLMQIQGVVQHTLTMRTGSAFKKYVGGFVPDTYTVNDFAWDGKRFTGTTPMSGFSRGFNVEIDIREVGSAMHEVTVACKVKMLNWGAIPQSKKTAVGICDALEAAFAGGE